MPSAVCRPPISQTVVDFNVGFSHGRHSKLRWLRGKIVCVAERDLHHGAPACILSSSLDGRLNYCCFYSHYCCRS